MTGVTTSSGSTITTTLDDAFDGYNALWVEVDDGDWTAYNQNGAAHTINIDRTVVLPTQTIDEVEVYRKVFVPICDEFCRWMNFFTDTSDTTKSITVDIYNNLGSDIWTRVHATSSGDTTADTEDNWIVSFQDYVGGFSWDPRLGHVLQGTGAAVPVSDVGFDDGDNNTYWDYTFDLAPGQTAIIMNFVTGQPSLAAAQAKAESLAELEGSALSFITGYEQSKIVNFDIDPNGLRCLGIGGFTTSGIPPVGRSGGDIVLVAVLMLALIAVRKTTTKAVSQI